MSIISVLMLAEYTRLVLTTDQSTRRIVCLGVWFLMATGWLITLVVRLKARRYH